MCYEQLTCGDVAPSRRRGRHYRGVEPHVVWRRALGGAQRFLSAFSGISPHFRPRRHLMTVPEHRAEMTVRLTIWDHVTAVADAAAAA
jgi:putative transposase